MKPHIKKLGQFWYCAGNGVIEFGYTPSNAYALWKAMQAHA